MNQDIIKTLKLVAKDLTTQEQGCTNEDISMWSLDDIMSAANEDGQIGLARAILEDLQIDWKTNGN